MSRRPFAWILGLSVLAGFVATAPGEVRPHAGMLRYPDVSATHIVFAYAGRLWLVPRTGGVAEPLASPAGSPGFPRFSADGQTIAFVGNYDGNDDLYTIPVTGGVPFRVTHHPTTETLCDWTPDGKLLFAGRNYSGQVRGSQLLVVPPTGGFPEKLPVPYGAVGAISPDGTWLAYTLHTTDSRTWKRYLGGMATDIWLFNLQTHAAQRITTWEGTDSQPMWHGKSLYYMCDDGPEHRLNIWQYELAEGKRTQITHFDKHDIKWPAIGPGAKGEGEIVFQYGPDLYTLDLATRQSHPVEVSVPGDRPQLRPTRVDVAGRIENWDVSPTGKRAAFDARGDIWTVPAHKGTPRNLTRSSGVAERDPAWSPDGRWIAYLSDKTGEYELYVTQSDGKGATRQLTGTGQADPNEPNAAEPRKIYRYSPTWSPDSKWIAFNDKSGALYVASAATGACRLVDQDPWSNPPDFSWSHDSSWLAYVRGGANQQSAIWLYHLTTREKRPVTSGAFRDTEPCFDRAGNYLFFATNRHFKNPIYEDIGTTFVYTNTDTIVAVPLRADLASPLAPKSDEESWKEPNELKKDEQPTSDQVGDADEDDEEVAPAEPGAGAREDEAATQPGGAGDKKPAKGPHGGKKGEAEKADKDKAEKEKSKNTPLEITLDGFEQRAIRLPIKPGAFSGLAVNAEGMLLYVRQPRAGSEEKASLKIFDWSKAEDGGGVDQPEEDEMSVRLARAVRRPALALRPAARRVGEEPEEQTVLGEVGAFRLSADGKKIIVHKDDTFAVVDAKPDQKLDKPMSLDGMVAVVDPRADWRQMVLEAWRVERDFFYDPHMHGVDWPGLRDEYLKMLDDCVSRSDVSFVIRELISELNVGHAYYFGDGDNAPRVSVGLLGADFELADGAYRIRRIITGGPWDTDARGPLAQPGIKVRAGDYLLAVNGVPLDVKQDPWAAFQGLAGKVVTLTVSRTAPGAAGTTSAPEEKPAESKPADAEEQAKKEEKKKEETGPHDIVVKLLSPEEDAALRYRAWVEHNRAYVAEKSGGKVGYVHVPDTGVNGQNELFRQFYGQRDKAALIVDERWNGGGQIPLRFIELLNRPLTNFWATRDGQPVPTPEDAHHGPKCMLINGLAGSGGDAFPFYFRQAKLGKLIGTRTWGGLVGISGNPALIDGATVTAPTFAFYKLDGTWGIEGHGVDPDIEVLDDPALMLDGADPQIDKAVQLMLDEVQKNPYVPVKVPPYPDRSGMGVPKKDW